MITTERESTVYARWPISLAHGSLSDIETAEVAAMSDPDARPASTDLVAATVVAADDPDLGRGVNDVLVLVGPAGGKRAADVTHGGGVADYQMWVAITTADEYILERAGTWEVT